MNTVKNILKEIMDRNGYTLTQLAEMVTSATGEHTSVQNISNKINRGSVRVNDLELWLNVMGYSLDYKENVVIDFVNALYPILLSSNLPEQDLSNIIQMLRSNQIPYQIKMNLRNNLMHGNNVNQALSWFVLDVATHMTSKEG